MSLNAVKFQGLYQVSHTAEKIGTDELLASFRQAGVTIDDAKVKRLESVVWSDGVKTDTFYLGIPDSDDAQFSKIMEDLNKKLDPHRGGGKSIHHIVSTQFVGIHKTFEEMVASGTRAVSGPMTVTVTGRFQWLTDLWSRIWK